MEIGGIHSQTQFPNFSYTETRAEHACVGLFGGNFKQLIYFYFHLQEGMKLHISVETLESNKYLSNKKWITHSYNGRKYDAYFSFYMFYSLLGS